MAVVGIQFRYDVMNEFFLNTTNKFNVPCAHLDVDCYLVDNNGFVVLSNHKTRDVGKFFGEIDGDILDELVQIGVYQRLHLFDYQAICLDAEIPSGPSVNPFMNSIVNQLILILRSFITWISLLYINLIYDNIWSLPHYSMAEKFTAVRQDFGIAPGITTASKPDLSDNQTLVRPCDKEFDLYEMINFSLETKTRNIMCSQSPKCLR